MLGKIIVIAAITILFSLLFFVSLFYGLVTIFLYIFSNYIYVFYSHISLYYLFASSSLILFSLLFCPCLLPTHSVACIYCYCYFFLQLSFCNCIKTVKKQFLLIGKILFLTYLQNTSWLYSGDNAGYSISLYSFLYERYLICEESSFYNVSLSMSVIYVIS